MKLKDCTMLVKPVLVHLLKELHSKTCFSAIVNNSSDLKHVVLLLGETHHRPISLAPAKGHFFFRRMHWASALFVVGIIPCMAAQCNLDTRRRGSP
jgi:hypothetical protein